MMQSHKNVQHRPLFPEDDDDGDFDNLDDLQFQSAVETNVAQSVLFDPNKGGVNASTGQVKAPFITSNNDAKRIESFEIEGPRIDLPPPELSHQQGVSVPAPQQAQPVTSSSEEFTKGIVETIKTSWAESRLGHALKESSHPVPCVFHILFKILALFFYIFGGWFAGASNFVTITVICIILLACDFWVVKNITGRLLVGLRWWNKVNEDGTTTWIFESSERNYNNKFDNGVFWGVTYGTPFIWSALFLVGLLKLELGWLMVVAIALVLSCSNVYGYWKCSTDQKVKFEQMIAQGAQMGVSSAIRHNVMGRISELAAARSQNNTSQGQTQPGMNFV